jgi:hypothetical protein
MVFLLPSLMVSAQTRSFTKDDIEYIVELPSPAWHAVSRLDVHDHVDFMYGGDSANGYLRLRKQLVGAGTTPADLFRHDEKWELQSLPGYVVCGAYDNFEGSFKGAAFSYEYTSGGRPMVGRIYYLRLDSRTFYALHYTVARDKVSSLRNEMDSIALSFRLKRAIATKLE